MSKNLSDRKKLIIVGFVLTTLVVVGIAGAVFAGTQSSNEEMTESLAVSDEIRLEVVLSDQCSEVNGQVIEGSSEESVVYEVREPLSVTNTVYAADKVNRGNYERYKANDIDAAVKKAVDGKVQEQIIEKKKTSDFSNVRTLGNAVVDENYTTVALKFVGEERDLLERIVMGEGGNQGFEGAALVAQCIRDTIVSGGYGSIADVRRDYKYSGRIDREPNEDVKNAVQFIFDEGGYMVKHRVIFFYNPKVGNGTFHEKQNFVVEHGSHRFFDRKG